MRDVYLNKASQPIGMWRWMELLDIDAYRQILSTFVYAGDSVEPQVRISTVWTGINTNAGYLSSFLPPDPFETMVFGRKGEDPLSCQRYTYIEQAWRGHFTHIRLWEQKIPKARAVMDWRFHQKGHPFSATSSGVLMRPDVFEGEAVGE